MRTQPQPSRVCRQYSTISHFIGVDCLNLWLISISYRTAHSSLLPLMHLFARYLQSPISSFSIIWNVAKGNRWIKIRAFELHTRGRWMYQCDVKNELNAIACGTIDWFGYIIVILSSPALFLLANMLLFLHSTVQIRWMKEMFKHLCNLYVFAAVAFLVGRFIDHVHKLRDLLFGHVQRIAAQMEANKEHPSTAQ